MQIPENVGTDGIGYGVSFPIFWIDRFHPHPVRQHTAFAAKSRTEVDAFYVPHSRPGGPTMGRLAHGGQIIMQHLCSIQTVPTSRRSSDTSLQTAAASAAVKKNAPPGFALKNEDFREGGRPSLPDHIVAGLSRKQGHTTLTRPRGRSKQGID
jgi:hypothetical protein